MTPYSCLRDNAYEALVHESGQMSRPDRCAPMSHQNIRALAPAPATSVNVCYLPVAGALHGFNSATAGRLLSQPPWTACNVSATTKMPSCVAVHSPAATERFVGLRYPCAPFLFG